VKPTKYETFIKNKTEGHSVLLYNSFTQQLTGIGNTGSRASTVSDFGQSFLSLASMDTNQI
jgi:4-alpha-glucanotransferase